MQARRNRAARRRLALVAFAALWLSACGGGGGDGTQLAAGGGSGLGTPLGLASGSAAPTPTSAASFSEFGPVRIASPVAATAPATARLAGGGNVVVWTTDGGRAVWAQTTTPAGVPVGSPLAVHQPNTQPVPALSVAATADGGFIVAYVVSDSAPTTQFAAVQGIQVRRYGPDGTLLSDTRANDQAPNYGSDGHLYSVDPGLAIKPLPDGGFVVGWTGEVALVAPHWGFLQRLAADGSRVGPMVVIGGGSPEVTQLTPAVLPDGTVVAVWQQQDFASSGSTYSIHSQHFGTGSAPLSAPAALAGTSRSARFPVGATALVNGSVAVAWAHADGVMAQTHSTLISADGAPTAPVSTTAWPITTPATSSPSDVAVVPLADGFGVLWQLFTSNYRAGSGKIFVQRHDGAGAATGPYSLLVDRPTWWVSATTGANASVSERFSADGGPDGHFTAAYGLADDVGNAYLLGR